MNRKIVLIVMDSLGIGAAKDAEIFGDAGADTLGHIVSNNPNISLQNLRRLGLFNIHGVNIPQKTSDKVIGAYGRCIEKSKGKDTTTGHWEMMGILTDEPFKVYPEGFPKEFIKRLEKEIGRGLIGNFPASGTEIIEQLGDEHESTGKPIIYTSADSVCQIAANTDIVSLEELYDICSKARKLLIGKWACARVIARPYIIEYGKRIRTSQRRDFSVSPPGVTALDILKDYGKTVYAIGKIDDIFNSKGISLSVRTKDNQDGIEKTVTAVKKSFEGLIFTNLVDFDSKFGHRRDPEGYAHALEKFDSRLPDIIDVLGEEDILLLTADHGNDPTFSGTDHTREDIPIIAYRKTMKNAVDLGIRDSFADIGNTILNYFKLPKQKTGRSFLWML